MSDIHIYYAEIVNQNVFLPEPFFSKYQNVGCDSRRNEITSTYLLLKQIKNIDLSSLRYNENGKPFIKDKYISISHDENMVIVAIGESNIGVDIIDVTKDYEPIQKSLGIKDKIEFCKTWTIIESYMKYLGVGLQAGYKNIKVDFKNKTLSYKGKKEELQFITTQIERHVVGVIASEIDEIIFDKVVL